MENYNIIICSIILILIITCLCLFYIYQNNNILCNVDFIDKRFFYLLNDFSTSQMIPGNLAFMGENINYSFSDDPYDIIKLNNLGFKYFGGIQSSSNLLKMLPFFESNPDNFMISASTNSSANQFINRKNRNVYRLAVPNYRVADLMIQITQNTDLKPDYINKINILFENGDSYSQSLTDAIISKIPKNIQYEILNIGTVSDIDNNLPKLFASNNTMNIMALVDSDLTSHFYNQLSEHYNGKGYFIDNVGEVPKLTSNLSNKYFFISDESVYERNVAKLISNFGITNSFVSIYDTVNMINSISKYGNFDNVIGSNGYLYFDKVGDRSFLYYLVYLLRNDNWNAVYQQFSLGNEIFSLSEHKISDQPLQSLLYTYNHTRTKGGNIAFILSNTTNDNDIILNLSTLGYNYPIFSVDNKNVDYLEALYNQNYRIFIGLNTTQLLLKFKPFFDKYGDCILISLYSTANILNDRNNINIYRMIPPDDLTYPYYTDFIESINPIKINFIVETNDVYSESLYNNMIELLNQPNTMRYNVSINDTDEYYNRIISSTNQFKNVTLICAVNDYIIKNIYKRLNNNIGTYIDGGSTTPRTPGEIVPYGAKNLYFLMFNPPFERNIQALINKLGNKASLPLIDALNMAQHIQKYGTFNEMIGSYGYSYFTKNGDRNFNFFAIREFNGKEWIIKIVYNNIQNKYFKSSNENKFISEE